MVRSGGGVDGDGIEESLDDGLDGDAFGLGAVIEEDAMAEGRLGEGLDVLGGDVDAASEQCADFGSEDEALTGAEAGATDSFLLGRRRRGAKSI